MDDKTMVAKYVAEESERLNQRMKDLIARGEMPSDEEKEALTKDMETTLERMKQALIGLGMDMDALMSEEEEEKIPQ